MQKVNKTQLKLCVCAIQTLTAFITCSNTPKAVRGRPQRKKQMKMVQIFSLLWDSIPKSHKIKRLRLLQNVGWDESRKNVALSTLLVLKLGDQMLCPYIIQTASNCVTLKTTGVHTRPQKDAATNPPIQGRKNTVICVHEQQMLTELNNKCVKATLKTRI